MELTGPHLRQALTASLAVERWVDAVAALAPFDSLGALLDVARGAASPLTVAEIDAALAHHPRIGEQARRPGIAAELSRREQGALSRREQSGTELAAAIEAGNAAYEERFGRIFLIRAAGRTPAEILAELHRRIELSSDVELAVVEDQLREIAMLRLAGLLAGAAAVTHTPPPTGMTAGPITSGGRMSHVTTHVLDAALGRPAAAVPVTLERADGSLVAATSTGADGRAGDLGPQSLPAGEYRLVFDTAAYFAATAQTGFYPRVSVDFSIADPAAHYHVPLLLSPFAYSTYRGS